MTQTFRTNSALDDSPIFHFLARFLASAVISLIKFHSLSLLRIVAR